MVHRVRKRFFRVYAAISAFVLVAVVAGIWLSSVSRSKEALYANAQTVTFRMEETAESVESFLVLMQLSDPLSQFLGQTFERPAGHSLAQAALRSLDDPTAYFAAQHAVIDLLVTITLSSDLVERVSLFDHQKDVVVTSGSESRDAGEAEIPEIAVARSTRMDRLVWLLRTSNAASDRGRRFVTLGYESIDRGFTLWFDIPMEALYRHLSAGVPDRYLMWMGIYGNDDAILVYNPADGDAPLVGRWIIDWETLRVRGARHVVGYTHRERDWKTILVLENRSVYTAMIDRYSVSSILFVVAAIVIGYHMLDRLAFRSLSSIVIEVSHTVDPTTTHSPSECIDAGRLLESVRRNREAFLRWERLVPTVSALSAFTGVHSLVPMKERDPDDFQRYLVALFCVVRHDEAVYVLDEEIESTLPDATVFVLGGYLCVVYALPERFSVAHWRHAVTSCTMRLRTHVDDRAIAAFSDSPVPFRSVHATARDLSVRLYSAMVESNPYGVFCGCPESRTTEIGRAGGGFPDVVHSFLQLVRAGAWRECLTTLDRYETHLSQRSLPIDQATILASLHAMYAAVTGDSSARWFLSLSPDIRVLIERIRRPLAARVNASGTNHHAEIACRHAVDAKALVEADCGAEVNLASVADALDISSGYLGRVFHEHTGEHFVDYLTRHRINTARSLLCETDLRICDIAHRVGYASPDYFSRLFRQSIGLSPQQYRSTCAGSVLKNGPRTRSGERDHTSA